MTRAHTRRLTTATWSLCSSAHPNGPPQRAKPSSSSTHAPFSPYVAPRFPHMSEFNSCQVPPRDGNDAHPPRDARRPASGGRGDAPTRSRTLRPSSLAFTGVEGSALAARGPRCHNLGPEEEKRKTLLASARGEAPSHTQKKSLGVVGSNLLVTQLVAQTRNVREWSLRLVCCHTCVQAPHMHMLLCAGASHAHVCTRPPRAPPETSRQGGPARTPGKTL